MHRQMNNWSPGTIANLKYSLRGFLRWASERGVRQVTDITEEVVEGYRRYLFRKTNLRTGQPIQFETQGSYLSGIAGWISWLHQQQWILTNPASKVERPKNEKRLPAGFLTIEQVESVLNEPDITTPIGLRDKAILETLYSTGIRRAELIALSVYDLQVDRQQLTIRQGKGGKDRIVPIGQRAIEWIEKYLQDSRREFLREPTDVLFLTTRGNSIHTVTLSERVKTYLRSAGITQRGSCHIFRHTMATLMLEGGADVRCLQAMLGHERLTTTQIYTHVTVDHLREVHQKTHPGSMDRRPQQES